MVNDRKKIPLLLGYAVVSPCLNYPTSCFPEVHFYNWEMQRVASVPQTEGAEFLKALNDLRDMNCTTSDGVVCVLQPDTCKLVFRNQMLQILEITTRHYPVIIDWRTANELTTAIQTIV